MKRRDLLRTVAALPVLACAAARTGPRYRVRPGDSRWPSAAEWNRLRERVSGRLIQPLSPLASGRGLEHLRNPYFLGDEPALTQTSGWLDAWTSSPSAYAVAAERTADVVAAVNFARAHNLRLVVKGGGHSYQGTSNAPDSLLIWTRRMNRVTVHDEFVAQGCADRETPQPAVTIEAGAMWADAYNAVTTRAGRYVQGGGCLSVGVAGLIQSGGFGSWSKNYGTASAGLLEAEVVTADGRARIANACTHPDLFWGLKGGGGGSLGAVTRLTLRTRELPEYFGSVSGAIKASSDDAFRMLIARMMAFYRDELCNPHWGEQVRIRQDNVLQVAMVFQGMRAQQAQSLWAPFLDWVRQQPEYRFAEPIRAFEVPARRVWDAAYMREHAPQTQVGDDRSGAPPEHVLWKGDEGQVGWFIHHFQSGWLPKALLREDRLTDVLFEASRHWPVELHFNKGMAGATEAELAAVRDTAMNPQVLDAFALAIIASGGEPAFRGLPPPDHELGRAHAAAVSRAMAVLLKAAPGAGAYCSESDYFQRDWQRAFWGTNYPRLAAVKRKYDPDGLFFVHHGTGSEAWSADGFARA
jgi:FAD/FMN-containing dehydrogenase